MIQQTNPIFFLQVATTLSWSEEYEELDKYRLVVLLLLFESVLLLSGARNASEENCSCLNVTALLGGAAKAIRQLNIDVGRRHTVKA